MINVMLADDHKIVREGFRNLLSTMEGVNVCDEASDGEMVLEKLILGLFQYDLLILDLTMPFGGVDLIRRVHDLVPELQILVLSMHNEGIIASNALQAGAAGYMTKDCDADTLFFAIETVTKGGKFIDPLIVEKVMNIPSGGKVGHERLSEREREILMLMVQGASLTEIANKLNISIKTVGTHKTKIMWKLNIETNAELIRYAVRQGLVS